MLPGNSEADTRGREVRTSVPGRLVGLGLVPALLVMTSCRGDAPPAGREAAAVLRDLLAADNAGDVDAIAALYAEDAVLLPPRGGPVRGREAIRGRYEHGFRKFALRVVLEEETMELSGRLAYSYGRTQGEYRWHDGSPPTPFDDTYLMVLAYEADGEWRVAVLMWSPVEDASPATEAQAYGALGDRRRQPPRRREHARPKGRRQS